MQIINAAGPNLPPQTYAFATSQAAHFSRTAGYRRPAKKILSHATVLASDVYVVIISLGMTPQADRTIIVNGNEFRLVSAFNETLSDGSEYPYVTWKGGIAPFVVKLVWHNPNNGGYYDEDVSSMCANVLSDLVDGDGDVVTAQQGREYIMTRQLPGDGWWADNSQATRNDLGLLITDSSPYPKTIFAPFDPEPTCLPNGYVPVGLFAKYPTGSFGPPRSCALSIDWSDPPAMTYGETIGQTHLTARVRIPGTDLDLAGDMTYWLDEELTIPANGSQPDATARLVVYANFEPSDTLHYSSATDYQTITVHKAPQIVDTVGAFHNTRSVGYWGNRLDHVLILAGESGTVVAYVNAPSGNTVVFTSSNPLVCTVGETTINSNVPSEHFATLTFIGAGSFYITADLSGNDNYLSDSGNSVVYRVGFARATGGDYGVTFDVNDSPVSYGEALDVLCRAPISGDETYTTAGQPNGWVVDPLPGTYLQTNNDGSDHEYSITAEFYHTQTHVYPSPMEYEQFLTVTQNTPVIVWEGSKRVAWGATWLEIIKTAAYNSHHVYNGEWLVQGDAAFTVSGHSNPAYNGEITDFDVIPDADSGTFIAVAFTPTGSLAHNYKIPAPAEFGIEITKRPQNVTILTKPFVDTEGPYTDRTQYFATSGVFNDSASWIIFYGTSDGSDNPVEVSVKSGNASITSGVLVCYSAGIVVLKATQAATTNYAAGYTEWSLTITLQTAPIITWNPSSTTLVYGDHVGAGRLNATAFYNGSDHAVPSDSYSVTQSYVPPAGTLVVELNYNPQVEGISPAYVVKQFMVMPLSINVYAHNVSKFYGAADPPLTCEIYPPITGVSLSGSLTREAGENIGQYVIAQGTISAGSNCQIIFHSAMLTIGLIPQILGGISIVASAGPGNPAVAGRTIMVGDTVVISIAQYGSSGNPVRFLLHSDIGIPGGYIESTSINGYGYWSATIRIVSTSGFTVLLNQSGNSTYAAANQVLAWTSGTISAGKLYLVSSNTSVVYNGSGQSFAAIAKVMTVSGLVPYNDVTIAYTYSAAGYGPTASPPVNVGTYTVMAVAQNSDYYAQGTWTLTITKRTPLITWQVPADIVYETPLTSTQLNAVADTTGTYVYTPAAGNILDAGEHALMVAFTPHDSANWTTVEDGVWLTVTKKTARMLGDDRSETYPVMGGATLFLNNRPYAIDYYKGSTYLGFAEPGQNVYIYLNAGTHYISEHIVDNNYVGVVLSTFRIIKAQIDIAIYGTHQSYAGISRDVLALSSPKSGVLLAVTYYNAFGNNAWGSIAPINVGTYQVAVTSIDINYEGTSSAQLSITKATPLITWPMQQIEVGELLSTYNILCATSDFEGVFIYDQLGTRFQSTGFYFLTGTFFPTDTANVEQADIYNGVWVVAATVIVEITTPSRTYGSGIDVSDRSAKSNGVYLTTEGAWSYTAVNTSGVSVNVTDATNLPVGRYVIHAHFEANSSSYKPAEGVSVFIVTGGIQAAVSCTATSDRLYYAGDLTVAAANGGSGSGEWMFSVSDPKVISIVSVAGNMATVFAVGLGSATVTAVRRGDGNYGDSATAYSQIITVGKLTQVITATATPGLNWLLAFSSTSGLEVSITYVYAPNSSLGYAKYSYTQAGINYYISEWDGLPYYAYDPATRKFTKFRNSMYTVGFAQQGNSMYEAATAELTF